MRSKLILSMIISLLMALSILQIQPAICQTQMSVINPKTGDNNFIFDTTQVSVGDRFNATVWLYEVTDLFTYQVHLDVNDTLLNITRAWIPTWDEYWIFYGRMSIPVQPVFRDYDHDGSREAVELGSSLLGLPGENGDGLLAIIEFEILYAPSSGETCSCALDIDDPETFIQNSELDDMDFTPVNGYYEISTAVTPEPPHAEFSYSPEFPLVGETVTFDASSSTPNGGKIILYRWNFHDGTPIVEETDPIITHVFTSIGDFNVTLTVFDDEGFDDTAWHIVTVVPSEKPILSLEPAFCSVKQGDIFQVNITLKNVNEELKLVGVQFKLQYNKTFIEALEVVEGPFMNRSEWAPYGTLFTSFIEEEPLYGSVVTVGILIMPNETGEWNSPFPSGGGTVATVTFNASGSIEGVSMLILNWTGLFDVDMNEIPHDVFHGQVELLLKVRDIAVILVEPSWTEIYEAWFANITVVVLNEGDVNATFTVSCRYNLNSSYGDIGTVDVTDLPSGENVTLIFYWQPSELGVYLIEAEASVIPGEQDTADNLLVSPHSVHVRIEGDVNGDNKVNMKDLGLVGWSFGSYPGDSCWNPMADFNRDNIIDIRDLVLVARNFGRTYP